MKKLLSVLLAVMMLLSAMPVMAEAHVCDAAVVEGEHYACIQDKTENCKAPTCEEDGWDEFTCQDPECTVKTFKKTLPKLGHKAPAGAESVIKTAATCEAPGVREWQDCVNCKKPWTETIEQLTHSWNAKEVVKPTCTAQGYTVYVCSACGAEKNDDTVEATNHTWAINYDGTEFWTEIIEPDCVTGGKQILFKYCEICKMKEYVANESEYCEPMNHQAVLDKLVATSKTRTVADVLADVAAADADNNGIIEKYSVVIGEMTSVEGSVEVNGWYHAAEITIVPAKCEVAGLLTIACTECDAKVELAIPALVHDFYYTDATESAPTCMEDGKILVQCHLCEYEKQVDVVAPHKHNYDHKDLSYSQVKFHETVGMGEDGHVGIDQIAQCIPYTSYAPCDGYEIEVEVKSGYSVTFVIDNCKAEFEKEVPGNGKHTPAKENYAFRDSTCTEAGYEYFYCVDCGYTYGREIPKKEHSLKSDLVKEPTCTEDGLFNWNCTTCNQTIKTTVAPKTGHNYELDKVNSKEKTCTKDGYELWVCSYCGDNYKKVLDKGHVAPVVEDIKPELNNNQAYKAPTCTETGLMSYECVVCHQPVINDVIPVLGHEWDRGSISNYGSYVKDGKRYETYKAATCEHVASWTRTCDHCGAVETVDGTEKLGHLMAAIENGEATISSLVLNTSKLPTCTETGIAYFNCAVCGDLIENFVLPALDHNKHTVWNPEKRVYEVTCISNHWDNYDTFMEGYLWEEISACTENEALAKQVYAQVMDDLKAKLEAKSENKTIPGVGCGATTKIEVNKTHYSIAISEDKETITLTADENVALLKKARIIVSWAYTLKDGTAFTFKYNFSAEDYEDLKEMEFIIGQPEAPKSAKLETISVVVTNTTDKNMGAAYLKDFGYEEFPG